MSRSNPSPIHPDAHPLSGATVTLNDNAKDPHRGVVTAGSEFTIEDWYDRVGSDNKSWTEDDGKPAATLYAFRMGLRDLSEAMAMVLDPGQRDEVVYGKIGPFGHAVHVTELGEPVQ